MTLSGDLKWVHAKNQLNITELNIFCMEKWERNLSSQYQKLIDTDNKCLLEFAFAKGAKELFPQKEIHVNFLK